MSIFEITVIALLIFIAFINIAFEVARLDIVDPDYLSMLAFILIIFSIIAAAIWGGVWFASKELL